MAGKRRAQGEGTLYYDATRARWVGQVWLDGRRRKVTAATKLDASAKLGKLIHGDPAERHVDKRTRIAGLLDDWQTKALPNRNLAASTVEVHAWASERWTEHIGTVKVADLDVTKVERALKAMGEQGLSRASLVKARSTLRQALAWAQRRRMVTFNAAAAAELPTEISRRREKTALDPEQVAALLEHLDGHPWQAMVALSARVGLRPGEAAGVCTDAVDLDSDPPTVAVIRAVHLEKGRPVLVEELKTSRARRTLALPLDVQRMLQSVRRRTDGAARLLFAGADGGPLWPSTVRAFLAETCEAIGLPRVTPNELRHSFATNLADAGVPPHVIADLLGHASTRMVDAVYRHRPAVIRGAEIA